VENRVGPNGNGDRTPDEIAREMEQTRESITEKVAALENQVVGTVQTAANTLTSTVEAVKSLVNHAPEAVTDTVKQAAEAVSETMAKTFDITAHVQKRPLAAVGVSAALGFVAGYLFGGGRQSLGMSRDLAPAYSAPTHSPAVPQAAAATPREPGIVDQLMGMVGSHVRELAQTAINSLSTAVKENIETGVPKLVGEAASHLTDMAGNATTPAATPGYTTNRFGQ